MPHEPGCSSIRPNPAAAKAVYSRAARKKLVDSRAKLESVTAVVNQAVATGRLRSSQQLARTLAATETAFAAAETQLRLLQKSGADEWDERRIELESAWEDLALSIRILAAHFTDSAN